MQGFGEEYVPQQPMYLTNGRLGAPAHLTLSGVQEGAAFAVSSRESRVTASISAVELGILDENQEKKR